MLEIRLLGDFDVRIDGEPVDIPSRPAQSLLAYLVLNAEARHRREKLAGMLWPDSAESNARSNLRHALWRLRKVIGNRHFDSDKVSISFIPQGECAVDAASLEDEHDEKSAEGLIRCVGEYGGELLPGFYENWVVLERERLRASFEQKIQRLLDLLINSGSWMDALEWAERWIALGHVPETAFRAMMIAYGGMGDLAGVAASYQRCQEALRSELGVEPSEQTRSTYDWLSKGGDPTNVAQVAPTALDRRTAEDSIRQLLRQWRLKGVEQLDLASLAMVHAARTDEPYEPEDAALLIQSALGHEVDVAPWLKRAGTSEVAIRALDKVYQSNPKSRIRARIVEAIKGIQGEEADAALLRIAENDDSTSIRSEAAVAASQRGKREAVLASLLNDINMKGDTASVAAFVAVLDEVGLPEDVGPYPKFPVALALAQRRWQDFRLLLTKQVGRAVLGAAIVSAIDGSAAPLYLAITSIESFYDTLQLVTVPTWMITGAMGMALIGGAQAFASSLSVGVADIFWRGRSRVVWRLILGGTAGLVLAGFMFIFTIISTEESLAQPMMYMAIYLLYGVLFGISLTLVFPQLGKQVTRKLQLRQGLWSSLAAVLATIPYVYGDLFVLEQAISNFPERLVFAIVLPLGIAIALMTSKETINLSDG
jgi:DNA-binding SARP family transcriptional activator